MDTQNGFHPRTKVFCEVSLDPEIVRWPVTRWLSVIDGGRMINEKTARNPWYFKQIKPVLLTA